MGARTRQAVSSTVTLAAGFASLYRPYNGFQTVPNPPLRIRPWGVIYRANTRFAPRRYDATHSTTGRAEGRRPSALFPRPPLPKGDQGG